MVANRLTFKEWAGRASCLALALGLLLPPTAQAQTSAEGGADPAEDQAQEIIVTGFREDLNAALARKRDEIAVADFLPVGELGELVTTNISEALEFVPGVVGTRFRGQVETLALRGLPPLLSLSTINGRVLSSKQGDRSVFFRLYPSDFFTTGAIYKSAAADQVEGGIAGTIVLDTPSPLTARAGMQLTTQVEYTPFHRNHRLTAKETGSRIKFLGTQKFEAGDNEFGVTFGFSHLNDPAVTGQAFGNPWVAATVRGTQTVIPTTLLFESESEVYNRDAVLGVLEWRSASGFHAKLDGIYTDTDGINSRNFLVFAGLNAPARYVSATFDGNALATAEVTNISVQNRVEKITTDNDAYMVGGRFGYEGGGWSVDLDAYTSKTSANTLLNRPVLQATGINGTISFDRDQLSISNLNRDLTDTSRYGAFQYFSSRVDVDDVAAGLRVDVAKEFSGSPLRRIRAGANFVRRDIEALTVQDINNNVRNAGLFPQLQAGRLSESFFSSDPYLNFDLRSATQGAFPVPFALIDHDVLIGGLPTPNFTVKDSDLLANSIDNREDTYAAFVQAEFEIGKLSGSLGVRAVRTELTSKGYTGNIVPVTDPITGAVTITVRGLVPATEINNYTKILPSLNAKYEFTPNLQGRLAVGRAMSRPEFTDLRLAEDLLGGDPATQPFRGTAGNPQLRPILSSQIDIGLEWYPRRGTAITIGGYYKRVSDFVLNQVRNATIGDFDYQLTSPVNARDGNFYGVEVLVRHDMDYLPGFLDGFGFIVNGTYNGTSIDPGYSILNDTSPGGVPLYNVEDRSPGIEGLTKWTGSGILFYEKDPIVLRFAARYAGDRVRQIGSLNVPIVSEARVYLDASATVKLSRNLRLMAQVQNLTEQVDSSYYVFRRYPGITQQNGRSFFFGASMNF